jgi:hypothetical protein
VFRIVDKILSGDIDPDYLRYLISKDPNWSYGKIIVAVNKSNYFILKKEEDTYGWEEPWFVDTPHDGGYKDIVDAIKGITANDTFSVASNAFSVVILESRDKFVEHFYKWMAGR